MKDAAAIYLVRFWIKPGHESEVMDWLDNGHIAEVVEQPGFLWARRYKLENDSEDGWPAYAMTYGLESIEQLHAYFENPIGEKLAREREERGLNVLLRMDRNWGVTEFGVGS
jgi:TRAP-type C4-dicarboxylate transport system substrate-binding protein